MTNTKGRSGGGAKSAGPGKSPTGATTATADIANSAAADIARFADFLRERDRSAKAERAEADRRRWEQDEARREREASQARLSEAKARKERAVRQAKELRAKRAPAAEVAAADAEYRAALADLEELETGQRPSWSPAPPVSSVADD
jgi:hypothetical protein